MAHKKLLLSQLLGLFFLLLLVGITISVMHYKRRSGKTRNIIPAGFQPDTATKTKPLPPKPILRLHTFDPNTVDSVELPELGFSEFQTRSFLRYRSKGKRWYRKEQMKTLYGLTDSAYRVLEPYIEIDTMPFYEEREQKKLQHQEDSLPRYEKKVKKDTVLELNSADTATLQWIQGIGSVRARWIVERREELGGYTSVEQLVELMHLHPKYMDGIDTILSHFIVEKDSVHLLPVNSLSAYRLRRHPYISYTLAKEIEIYRYKYGPIKNEKEFRRLPSLRNANDSVEAEIQKLLPYLSFEVEKRR